MTEAYETYSLVSSWAAAVLFIFQYVLVLTEPKIKAASSRDACHSLWLGRSIHRPPHHGPFISPSAMNVTAAMSRPLLLMTVVGSIFMS